MGYLERMKAEEAEVDRVVRGHPWPPFVVGYEARYGADHDGDPACWILFHTIESEWPMAQRIAAMDELTDAIRPELLDLLHPRWTYFRFPRMPAKSPLSRFDQPA